MHARVDTTRGPRRYLIRGPRDVERAATILTDADIDDLITGRAPPWQAARVRYRREGPRMAEDWARAARVAARGWGDCEDLAAYRAADLITAGIPAAVRAYLTRDGRTIHVVVELADGTILDPSRERGMGRKMRYRVGYDPEVGLWSASVAVPGVEPIYEAFGIDGPDALSTAILAADDDQDDVIVAGIGEMLGSLAGSFIPGGSAIGGMLGGLAEQGARALGGLISRRRQRRVQRDAGGGAPVSIIGPGGQVTQWTGQPGGPGQRPQEAPLRPAVQQGTAPSGPSLRPMPRDLARLHTAAALAQGVQDARGGDQEAWRALATIARVLRSEDPGGPWHRLVRALGVTR